MPITSPSSGVSPIDVSTAAPPRTAEADAPLPRCSTICLSSAGSRPSTPGTSRETYWCEVPWNPYRRIWCSAATVAVDRVGRGRRRQVAEERGVEHGDLRDARERHHGLLDAASALAGLCSGASSDSSRICCSTVVIDHDRVAEDGAAVHHPVPDRRPARRSASELPASANSCCMIRQRRCRGRRSARRRLSVSPCGLVGGGPVAADPLDQPGGRPPARRPGRPAGTSSTTTRS